MTSKKSSIITVGDTVKIIGFCVYPTFDGNVVNLKNFIGVVRTIGRYGYGIEFYESFQGGHDLHGSISSTRGWYVIDSEPLLKLHPIKDLFSEESNASNQRST